MGNKLEKSINKYSNTTVTPIFNNSTVSAEKASLEKSLWQPFFQENVEKASEILSYLVSFYMILIFLFVLIKTTLSHGVGNWIIYKPGFTKFPRRPEIIVIMCSTIPTMLTIQSRAALMHCNNITIEIGYRWGSCQTVLFFDIFTRTAALYHMLYWTYSLPINLLLWRIYIYFMDYEHEEKEEADFKGHCKRRIPCVIYVLSFIISMPILIIAEKSFDQNLKKWVCAKIPAYIFYHYYDLVMLIIVPLVLMVIRFYSSALDKNKNMKMIYRLRCYHVTFVLLTIPILVLNIVFEIFTLLDHKIDLKHQRFANGVIISVTAYHTSFIIRPLVYTTGCNCICCGDSCLLQNPRINRWVIYWSTPQHKDQSNIYSQPIQVTID